jgi:hypothetical protein
MTNEEALEILTKERVKRRNASDGYPTRYAEALGIAIEALEQTRWIPVSERLPEREGWYLTSLGDKTYGGADVDMYCKGWVKYGTHVIAWMPLPEPYREEDDNEAD